MDAADIDLDQNYDQNFETTQFRERSNTWPLRPTRELLEAHGDGSPASEDSNLEGPTKKEGDPLGLTTKKSGSRRNAWGNLSYADLITKAIGSSPEKRLTLSQIYDWMVQNVPYFKDKGDSTSSAGWKNSIRHNLSLHNRFMRIQNEGTGKSSWWVINPDAKPGKAPRRRAGSMETKYSLEKKRGRAKKRVEALRAAAMENGGSPLGSDDFLDQLSSFGEFRQRTSSNASSCGRLSPIHAGVEPDLHDSQVPPMSPIPWGAEADEHANFYNQGEGSSELLDTLVVGMKLSQQDGGLDMNGLGSDTYLTNGVGGDYSPSGQSYMSSISENVNEGQFSHLPAPPPYPDRSPNSQTSPIGGGSYTNLQRLGADMFSDVMEHMNSPARLSINPQQPQISSPDRSQQNSPNPQAFSRLSPQAPRANSAINSPLNCQLSPQQTRALLSQRNSPSLTQQQIQQNAQSILRDALTRGAMGFPNQPVTTVNAPFTLTTSNNINTMLNMGLSPHHHQQQQHLQQQQQQQPQMLRIVSTISQSQFDSSSGLTGCGMVANTHTASSSSSMPTINGNNNIMPLDIDMDSLINVPGDYDMDSIIKQELSLEGNLDFNFDNVMNGPTSSQNIVH